MNTVVHESMESMESKILNKLKKLIEATDNQIKTFLLDGQTDFTGYIENNMFPVVCFDTKGDVVYANQSMNHLMKSAIRGTNIKDRCPISQLVDKDGHTATIYDNEKQPHKVKVFSSSCDCSNKKINRCLLLPTE